MSACERCNSKNKIKKWTSPFFKKRTEKWTESVHFFKKWTVLTISPGTNLGYAISLVSRLIFTFETKN